MADSADPTSAVQAALEELSDLLPRRYPRERRGWDVDAASFLPVWNNLEKALNDRVEIMHNPRPGQGLASLWLRAIARRAANAEDAVQCLYHGWKNLLRCGDRNLSWLTEQGRHAGRQLVSGGFFRSGWIGRLLEPKMPLTHLREMAAEWETTFQRAPREPQGFELLVVVEAWQPWGAKRNEYIRRAGVLILEAVDVLNVNMDLLGKADFAELVLASFDGPEYLPSNLMSEQTPKGLLALVDRLEPETDAGSTLQPRAGDPPAEVAAPNASTATSDPKAPYPDPDNYARDGWVYENIQKYQFSALSVELEKVARRENWNTLTSRNGFKDAAKRYAKYHGLPERVFRKATVTE